MKHSKKLYRDLVDHNQLFDGANILGRMSSGVRCGQYGDEVNGWVLNGFQNKGVGKLGLTYAEQITFTRQDFNQYPFALVARATDS